MDGRGLERELFGYQPTMADALVMRAEREAKLSRDSDIDFDIGYAREQKRRLEGLDREQRAAKEVETRREENERMLQDDGIRDYVTRLNLIEPALRTPSLAAWIKAISAVGMHPIVLGDTPLEVAIAYANDALGSRGDDLSDKAYFFFCHLVRLLCVRVSLKWPVVEKPFCGIPFTPAECDRYLRELIEHNLACELDDETVVLSVPIFPATWSDSQQLELCENLARFHVITNEEGALVSCGGGAVGYRLNKDSIECRFFKGRRDEARIQARYEQRLAEEPGHDKCELTQNEQLVHALALLEDPSYDLSGLSPTDECSIRMRVADREKLHGVCEPDWERWLHEGEIAREREAARERAAKQAREAARERAEAAQQVPPQPTRVPSIWMPDGGSDPARRAAWVAEVCDFRSINALQLSYLTELMGRVREMDGLVGVTAEDLNECGGALACGAKNVRRIIKALVGAGCIAPVEGHPIDYVLVAPGIREKSAEGGLKGAWEDGQKKIISGSSKEGYIYRLSDRRFSAEYKTAQGKTKVKLFDTVDGTEAERQIAAWRAEEREREEARMGRRRGSVKTQSAEDTAATEEAAATRVPEWQEEAGDTKMEIGDVQMTEGTGKIVLVMRAGRIIGYAAGEDEALAYVEAAGRLIAYSTDVLGMEGGKDSFDYQEVQRLKPIPSF